MKKTYREKFSGVPPSIWRTTNSTSFRFSRLPFAFGCRVTIIDDHWMVIMCMQLRPVVHGGYRPAGSSVTTSNQRPAPIRLIVSFTQTRFRRICSRNPTTESRVNYYYQLQTTDAKMLPKRLIEPMVNTQEESKNFTMPMKNFKSLFSIHKYEYSKNVRKSVK